MMMKVKEYVMKNLHYSVSKRDILLSCLSGALLIFLFPKFNLGFLAWVALVPLFVAVKGKDHAQAFGLAWLTGIVYFSGVLRWVVNTMIDYGHLSRPTSYLILFMLVVYLSFYVALFGFFLGHLDKSGYRKWFVAPFLWTSLEYLRAHVFTGFPWAALGYSQFQNLRIIQIADITGVYGLSFLVVLINVLFFLLLESVFKKDILTTKMKEGLPSRRILLVLLFLCFSLPLFYGSLKIGDYRRQIKQTQDSMNIALVQGNIEQDKKWDPEYVRETIDIYKKLTRQISENHPKLIVWPETATPFYFQSDKKYSREISALSKDVKAPILFGSPAYRYVNGKIRLYNRAYLIDPQGEVAGMYDKIHLVPFGEYVPLKRFLFFVDKLVEGIGEFDSGSELTLFDVSGKKFGTLICFEIIFPQYSRRLVGKGAGFLVNITNDAWFGRSAASYQHIAMVVFRAVENRVPVVRSANTGISGFVSPIGSIEGETDIFVRTAVEGKIFPMKQGSTFYTLYGDLFVSFCLFIVFSVFSWTFVLRYKRRKNASGKDAV